MAHLRGDERVEFVGDMFSRIAPRYDLMNRLMTAGQDIRWRREVIRRAELPFNGNLLDVGAGTGDLAQEALQQNPDSHVVAFDLTLEMMRLGRRRRGRDIRCREGKAHIKLEWSAGDAQLLPFNEAEFDAVVSGFLIRNVIDVRMVLDEQYRVLKPGGRMIILDTTRPIHNPLSPVINFHLGVVIPILGRALANDKEAYAYLNSSTQKFLLAEQLASRMVAAGFVAVGFRRLMLGTVAIHWGLK
jgi:demethylmenaquinone methyltransferase/2-methoxy-6-polyprenyl-1,4-benzoquinol methylase